MNKMNETWWEMNAIVGYVSLDRIPSALHCAICHGGQLRGRRLTFNVRAWGSSVAT